MWDSERTPHFYPIRKDKTSSAAKDRLQRRTMLLNSCGRGSRKDDLHSGAQIPGVLELIAVPLDDVPPSSRVLQLLFRDFENGVAWLDNVTGSRPSRRCHRCHRYNR